uniref:BTB domain-containing protein n=1 Tax=Hymenolepis diminuta TaxID=6216 RepID=A0A0R3SZ81_HYMDI
LIQVFPDSADSLVDWSRFPHEIVEAVLSFAYTGSITINSENVLQLLLFAYNLRSSQLIEWCNDFLASRINVDNVVDIWVVANVTVNEDLISSCLATIRDHIDDLINDSRFFTYTEPKGMAMMICDESILSKVESSPQNHESASSPTDQLLTKWLSNSESNTLGTSVDVVARFEDLISSLNLQSIPIEILGELSTKAIELNASKACMLNLAAAMKAPRQLSENTPTMLHSVDKKWSALPDMPEAKSGCSATTLLEREFVVVGGEGSNGVSKTVHLLTEEKGAWQWKCLPSMLTARIKPGIAYYESQVFVAGGNFNKDFDIECLKVPQDEGIAHQWTLISTLDFVPTSGVQLLIYSKRLHLHACAIMWSNSSFRRREEGWVLNRLNVKVVE